MGADKAAIAGIDYPQKLQDLGRPITRLALDGSDLYFASVNMDGANVLYRYRAISDALTQWALPADPGGGWFVGIAGDGKGVIWVAWDSTLVRFDTASERTERFELPASQIAVPNVEGTWVRDLAVASDGTVWLSRHNAKSLLKFDSSSRAFQEFGLPSFGVPDRIYPAKDGRLWLTLARDAQMQAHSSIALFDMLSGLAAPLPQRASAIASVGGSAVLVGAGAEPRLLDGAVGVISVRYGAPFVSTGSDVVDISSDGTIVLANRVSGSIAVRDASTSTWETFKLQSEMVRPNGVFPGRTGPAMVEQKAEVTDIRIAPDGTIWAANPSYGRIVRLVAR